MPKRSYDLSFVASSVYRPKKGRMEKEEKVVDEAEAIEPVMDIFGMGDSVSIRDNHIYFYGSVTKNAVKINTALKDITRKLLNIRNEYSIDNPKIYLTLIVWRECLCWIVYRYYYR